MANQLVNKGNLCRVFGRKRVGAGATAKSKKRTVVITSAAKIKANVYRGGELARDNPREKVVLSDASKKGTATVYLWPGQYIWIDNLGTVEVSVKVS